MTDISPSSQVAAPEAQPAPELLLSDRAYEALRDQIVTLKIKPGQPIDEELLGRQLGIGRTPVREAIKRLALENLVTVFPRRGTFTTEINITDLGHITDARMVLDGHAAYRAATLITPAQRVELAQLLDSLQAAPASDDVGDLMSLDTRVHRFIYRCADNPYLAETCGRYFNLSLRFWYLMLDRIPHLLARMDEHHDCLSAIAAGQSDRARTILAEHIATFGREIRSLL
jgi:DNA-binding GntR family transcriptional regulator